MEWRNNASKGLSMALSSSAELSKKVEEEVAPSWLEQMSPQDRQRVREMTASQNGARRAQAEAEAGEEDFQEAPEVVGEAEVTLPAVDAALQAIEEDVVRHWGDVPESYPTAVVVKTRERAREVLKVLEQLSLAETGTYHACDTEVANIDLARVGPVGNGEVICVSIYSGPEVDFGEGKGKALWIDNDGDAAGVLDEFRSWFEDERFAKVWHNYGFDRHVMYNPSTRINVRGFGGDTMHMARLWDTGRDKGGGGYGLEALTETLLDRKKVNMKELFGKGRVKKDGSEGALKVIPPVRELQNMKSKRADWIKYSAYDAEGTWLLRQELEAKLRAIEWQPLGRPNEKGHTMWDFYQRYYVPFGELLTDMEREGVHVERDTTLLEAQALAEQDRKAALRTFRDWAASISPAARFINPASSTQLQTFFFGGAAKQSKDHRNAAAELERKRVFEAEDDEEFEPYLDALAAEEKAAKSKTSGPGVGGGLGIALGSELQQALVTLKATQLKQLCKSMGLPVSGKKHALVERIVNGRAMPQPTSARAPSADEKIPSASAGSPVADDPWNLAKPLKQHKIADLRALIQKMGLPQKIPSKAKKADLIRIIEEDMGYAYGLQDLRRPDAAGGADPAEAAAVGGGGDETFTALMKDFLAEVEENSQVKTKRKRREFEITSLGLTPKKFTTGGWPAVSADVLRDLAGEPHADPPRYGSAFKHFQKNGMDGKAACEAIYALHSMSSIDTMLSNFIEPLRTLADEASRVHCSMNINTETGRLSARRPNLQNQPALEKDQYKIRAAFSAEPGRRLIVADYGQLELRLLAHMTSCTSMIDAFKAGGCFHSRTAAGMFPHVRKAVDEGEVLLEWDYNKGAPPKPLLKDFFGSERRKAKTLNFSIAYGKTVHGLSKDWAVSVKEATEILEAWYADRPEVEKWQKEKKRLARKEKKTQTLMGRYRALPRINESKGRGHGERAAINTPIQGGAADIVVLAMIRLHRSDVLKQLGYKLLLQVHDEVILEGPEEHVDEALAEVRECMEKPWDHFGLDPLLVDLTVDAKHARTWYEAK